MGESRSQTARGISAAEVGYGFAVDFVNTLLRVLLRGSVSCRVISE